MHKFVRKNVANYALLRCKTFSLKNFGQMSCLKPSSSIVKFWIFPPAKLTIFQRSKAKKWIQ